MENHHNHKTVLQTSDIQIFLDYLSIQMVLLFSFYQRHPYIYIYQGETMN